MLLTINSYLPILISVVSMLGMIVHDSHAGSALLKAVESPALTSINRGLDNLFTSEHHIHVDASTFNSFSMRTSQPSAQPKNDTDKKYIAAKRSKNSSFGTEYIWPSI